MATSVHNLLVHEQSPYLLQHAYQPVHWFPWGDTAFQRAHSENKPIFLSIGYSTCHWCHVMAHESFDNLEIAEFLNRFFISIKVDREERPDVDQTYMLFVQATTGSGGWPTSVWLTPDLKPFVGGTYFPPDDAYGRMGFLSLLKRIAQKWATDEALVREQSNSLCEQLQNFSILQYSEKSKLSPSILDQAFHDWESHYDRAHGGFGSAPKFPQPSILKFLLNYALRKEKSDPEGKRAMEMVTHTLQQMANGGIHDHLGGGFHRYSVDPSWHLPHFEKMLYDQAQLAEMYLTVSQIDNTSLHTVVAQDILKYVHTQLTSPEGGFFSAEDADSHPTSESDHTVEGAFYVWEPNEIEKLLGEKKSRDWNRIYGVSTDGNVPPQYDHRQELQGKNVLSQVHEPDEAFRSIYPECRSKLLEARSQRPRPSLDDKVITAWNGLMISAFAKSARILQNQHDLQIAEKAGLFLQKNLYRSETKTLIRSWRNGIASSVNGFLADYAFLIQGLLDLYDTSLNIAWLEWADLLQTRQIDLFWDESQNFFRNTTSLHSVLPYHPQDHTDGAEPSASGIATINLLRLAALLDRRNWHSLAQQIVHFSSVKIQQFPREHSHLLLAGDLLAHPPPQLIVHGHPRKPETSAFLKTAQRSLSLGITLLWLDDTETQNRFIKLNPSLKTYIHQTGKTTGYVCSHQTCQPPTTDLQEWTKQLSDLPMSNFVPRC